MDLEMDTSAGAELWVSRYKRRNGLIGALVLVLVSSAFWFFFSEALEIGSASRAIGWGLFALLLDSVAGMAVWVGVFRWGHPATSLRVDSDGVVVHYPRRSRAMKWADHSLKLTIRRLNHYAETGSVWGPFTSTQWSVIESKWTFWPRIILRQDQEAALVEAASNAGMVVERVKDPMSDSGESVRIVAGSASPSRPAKV